MDNVIQIVNPSPISIACTNILEDLTSEIDKHILENLNYENIEKQN